MGKDVATTRIQSVYSGWEKFDSVHPKTAKQLRFDIAGCVQPTEEYLEEGGRSEGLFPDGWIFFLTKSPPWTDRKTTKNQQIDEMSVLFCLFCSLEGGVVGGGFGWWSHIFTQFFGRFGCMADMDDPFQRMAGILCFFFGAGVDFQHRSARERWLKYSFWL